MLINQSHREKKMIRVTMIGRVGKKELKTTKNGSKFCILNVVTSKRYLDGNGQLREITNWFQVYFFDKNAELAEKFGQVGSMVYIEAEMNNRKIVEPDGSNRTIQMINGSHIQFIPTGRKEQPTGQDNPTKESSNEKAATTDEYYMNSRVDDDIGF